ncbi:MAG: hypothetical protein OXF26_13310 [Alphaproteobacteria bacterium]|nr:hypothetical protein [Alphaproteobacteria bacterium]
MTGFEDGRVVRLVTEGARVLWHTTFTVTPNESDDEARLEMLVRVEPVSFVGKLVTPFLRPAAVKGITADVEAVKAYV